MKRVIQMMTAGVAAVAFSAVAASAGSLTLGTSGWSAHWSSELDGNVALNVDGENDNAVYIEKFINFQTNDPVRILFQQTPDSTATPYIVINDEQLVNRTGTTWNGFTMSLVGVADNATFDTAKTNLGGSGGFSIDPFTSGSFSNGDTVLTVGGGTVPSTPGQNVWFPGGQSGALWTIHPGLEGAGLRSFILTEQPLAIPLPAAFWSGLVGLGGLGLLGLARRRPTVA